MFFPIEDVGRGYLGDRLLVGLMLTAIAFLAVYFSMFAWLPTTWQTPGSLPLYVLGVFGTALLLVSMVFVWVKRTGRGGLPPAWFTAHVVAAILGMVLVAVTGVRSRRASHRLQAAYVDKRARPCLKAEI